ncbi:hypothetical protein EDB84DRAFT_1511422 [Lactarius hengduanensis]|nr:hypothetical protein EDB84DRAFT_1511422 [Lactarius hengduanensis]
MLEESLTRNIIIALDTGAGKTHIVVLRLKLSERCYGSHRAQGVAQLSHLLSSL